MRSVRILWTDDEIDLLQPHILFLQQKGYEITTASNGDDALDIVSNEILDLVFLDENMPGLSGLETLSKIKEIKPNLPVVMITKSEEENIMDAAIGSQINDYLIKPVNPNQILLSIKKNIDVKKLVSKETVSAYQSEFGQIGMQISMAKSFTDWEEIFKKLVYWELELEKSEDTGMNDVLKMQKSEANTEFSKYIKNNYLNWFNNKSEKPLLSPSLIKEEIAPIINNSEKLFFILIDNLRFDQWKILQPDIEENFIVEKETTYFSILPTATQYSRNALFAGLMPSEIAQMYPNLWLNDTDEGGKNQFEFELIQSNMSRLGIKKNIFFEKISNTKQTHKLTSQLNNIIQQNDVIFLVYNFIDIISHANTDVEMVRELAHDDNAYRSLTKSWYQHSDLQQLLQLLAEKNIKVVITTDHGTIRVQKPIKVVGDKSTSKNLRYKTGKNLSYNAKEVFEVKAPHLAYLPKSSVSSSYIFALENDFFAYPNNFNHYVSYYTNTFQHGGISMEEMIIPLIILQPKEQ